MPKRMLQAATEGYKPRDLTVEQLNAIDLLVTGRTDQETAAQLGIHRVTVTRWRNYSPEFAAELNKKRKEVYSCAVDRLRALAPEACDVLANDLRGPNAGRAAVAILRLAGLDKVGEPAEPTDATALVDEMITRSIRSPQDRLMLELAGISDERRLQLIAQLDAHIAEPQDTP